MCEVKVNKKSVIIDQSNEELSLNDIEEGDSISVVLAKRKVIRKDKHSREVIAKKMTLLD
ncbi:hypothetical protein ACTWP4_03665 [Gracilibacillus sp. D59]|uniref:hypothetical protein n=1 Tax=Gracilibacillus sp. D59 TaxID=3457434 RepID=UPI003FCD3C47